MRNLPICFCGTPHLLWCDVSEMTVLSCGGRSCSIIFDRSGTLSYTVKNLEFCSGKILVKCLSGDWRISVLLVLWPLASFWYSQKRKRKKAGAPCLKINKETLPFVNDLTARRVISSTVTKHCCETSWVIWAPACKLPDISTERTHSITGNCCCTIC